VPFRTCSKALVCPFSPKIPYSGGVSKGVCLAWVKRRPASAKQACSSSVFLVNSCRLPVPSSGATTIDRGCLAPDGFKMRLTFWAVFLILSTLRSCFHNAFFVRFHASDCAVISCAIHVSRLESSFFSRRNCLWAPEICSSIICCEYSPTCSTVGNPAFLARVRKIDNPTFPPFSHFKRFFQNKILLIAAVILGHHWIFPHLSFRH